MKTILLAASLILPSLTFAQSEWVLIGESVSHVEFWIKDFNKTYSPDVLSGWVKTINPDKNIKNKKGKLITVNGKSSVSNWEINCSQKEYNLKQTINYTSNGEITDSYNSYTGWMRVAPDSMAEGVLREACKDYTNQ